MLKKVIIFRDSDSTNEWFKTILLISFISYANLFALNEFMCGDIVLNAYDKLTFYRFKIKRHDPRVQRR